LEHVLRGTSERRHDQTFVAASQPIDSMRLCALSISF
jgi:hypothetical protein